MKTFIITAFILFISNVLFAQAWTDLLPKNKSTEELTLKDYQNAFYTYWAPFNLVRGKYKDENGIIRKATGWKQFKRWEWYMESRVDLQTGEFPKTSALDEIKKNRFKLKSFKGSPYSWINLGTNSSGGGGAGIGRINCIAFHPTDINTYWVGAPSGGLWKTANNGNTWSCLTDSLGVMGISSVLIAPDYATSKTIYIGTGDRDALDNRSIGVLKSIDGGVTWNQTGLSFQLYQGFLVTKMLMDPGNQNHILVCTNVGIYETFNGGTDFTKISNNYYIDIENKPGFFNRFYCGTKTTGRIDILEYNGVSWQSGTVKTIANGKRVEIAVCPSQNNWVYAIVADNTKGLAGIYKSENEGNQFSEIFGGSNKNLLGWSSDGSDAGGQGSYDLCIIASPNDASTLLIGGVNTWKSINGGLDWSIVNHWNGDLVQPVHADKHNFAYRSDGTLFEVNDGGIYLSADNGNSGSWIDKTNGITISQIYKLGVSVQNSNEIITGLQDNGSKLYSGGVWRDIKGGDGMECLIDFTDDNVQYATYANGQITRTLDHWINDRKDIEPKDDQGNSLSGAWITPYIIHPDNSKFLYAGYQDIYKSENRGDTWTKISSINTSNNFRTMAVCEYASNNIYAADQTQLWKSSDGGVNWVSKSSNLPTGLNSYILSIAVKSDDPNILWITLSGFQHDGVYESTNGGDTWTSISTGLPQIPIYTIVYNKLEKSRNDLYIGTEVGVFYKAGSAGWIYYSHGLPNVFVDELEIFYDKNNPEQSKLIAATYGRGLWEAPLVSSGNFVPELTQAAVSNLTSNSATFTASINNDYGNAVIQSGFVYSSSEYPVLGTSGSVKILTSPAATIGQFSIDAHGLTFPFYVRPFAVNSNGVGYGKAKAYDKNGSPLVVEDIEKYGIKIYPNPTEGDISIQFDQLWGNMMVSVLNMAGKTIETKKVDSKLMKFYLNKQAKGIYMIEISWPGNRLTSKVLFN